MRHLKRTIALLLVAAFAVGCFMLTPIGAAPARAATEYEDLQNERINLQKQLIQLKKDISSIQNETSRLKAYAKSLSQQIELVRGQIELLTQSIDLLNTQIAEKQQELDQKERDIEDTYELFALRLRAMYMANTNTSLLSTLLSANSFSDFLSATEYMRRIAIHDNNIVERLTREKAEIVAAKEEIEAAQLLLDADKVEQEQLFDEVSLLIVENDQAIDTAAARASETAATLSKVTEALEANEREIQSVVNQSNGQYIGGVFTWPAPGYSGITSKYGYRIHPITGQRQSFHSGIDISGWRINGAPVVAANSGTVSLVRYYTTGYGYYVIVDHGGGVYTLYAHLSRIAVSQGAVVVQGQTIAYVGSTGASTGPHLHFEIRISGQTVDPLSGYVAYGR